MAGCSRLENKQSSASEAHTPETSKAAAPDGPPADVVRVTVSPVDITAGGNADASVKILITKGYHINGNPASKYQIATTLEVPQADGITPGKAVYPQGVSKKFSFSNEAIMVYDTEVLIKQPLQAERGVLKTSRTLRGTLKVQPCDDTVCYPPRTLEVSIPVNVN